VEFRKCARDLKTLSAAQKHTNEERGGSRDPGVRRPGAGRGQFPARSKILHFKPSIFGFSSFHHTLLVTKLERVRQVLPDTFKVIPARTFRIRT